MGEETLSPRTTQKVLFSSAPAATIEREAATGSGSAPGTKPRDRRTGRRARTTESSQRAVDRPVMGEECVGDPAEPLARLVVVGARSARRSGCRSSSRARPRAPRAGGGGAACTAASGRARACPGATDGATGRADRRRTSTIGRSREPEQRILTGGARRALRAPGHHRERLVLAELARPEPRDRRSSAASQARW